MENAALPLLNIAILGGFLVVGLRSLSNLKTRAIEVELERRNIR